jgi:hypothetical protein
MIIVGGGLSGCLAGVLTPGAQVFESSETIPDNHKAVLRFRERKISDATGIPFKEVTVNKAIWYQGEEHPPTPRLCNKYSRKVAGRILTRSIWDLKPVRRYIAPHDLHHLLADCLGNRLHLGKRIDASDVAWNTVPVVSTIPMHMLASALGMTIDQDFRFERIEVSRYKVSNADVHQTIYYPALSLSVYRATLTGEDLIVESTGDINPPDLNTVLESLGLVAGDVELVEQAHQQYGKIAPIDELARKQFIFHTTINHNIFSLGRYAIWKNILLDDVYDDLLKIKSVISDGHYKMLSGDWHGKS